MCIHSFLAQDWQSCCMDPSWFITLLQSAFQGYTIALSSSLAAPRVQECRCVIENGNLCEPLERLLKGQLDRAVKPLVCPGCPVCPAVQAPEECAAFSLTLRGFFIGVLVGAIAASSLCGCAGRAPARAVQVESGPGREQPLSEVTRAGAGPATPATLRALRDGLPASAVL